MSIRDDSDGNRGLRVSVSKIGRCVFRPSDGAPRRRYSAYTQRLAGKFSPVCAPPVILICNYACSLGTDV